MIPGVPLLAQNTAVDKPASYSISQPAQQSQLLQLLLLTSQPSGDCTVHVQASARKHEHAHVQTPPQCIKDV